MNQILSTENINNQQYKQKRGPKDIRSIVRFFAVVLIIFGIFLITNSSLALFTGKNDKKEESLTKPEIQLENKGKNQIILKIMHDKGITRVEYSWNGEDVEVINGAEKKYIEKTIDIPTGENVFEVKAIDVNGQESEYSKTYTLEGNIKIEIKQSGNNIQVDVSSKDEIKSIEYAWDDEEWQQLEFNSEEKQQSFKLEVRVGEHELVVKVADKVGNTEEKTQAVTGTTKPTVKLSKGDGAYVITAHDEIALDRIEITTVDDGKKTIMESDGKDFTYNFPLKEGDENKIQVIAYNSNGVESEVVKAKWKK